MADASGRETSLKQIFQSMAVTDFEFLQGTVISASPLKIQIANDEKLVINERITIVPWHLTNYTTTATFSLGRGSISSVTEGDGSHGGHIGGDGKHDHHLVTYTLSGGTITMYNALKAGEKVHILSLNNGKKYYVLDRVVS